MLDHGRIVERGRNRELLALRGSYHAPYSEFIFTGLAGEGETDPAARLPVVVSLIRR